MPETGYLFARCLESDMGMLSPAFAYSPGEKQVYYLPESHYRRGAWNVRHYWPIWKELSIS